MPSTMTAVQALEPPRRPRSAPAICSRCLSPIVGEPSVVRPISGPLARRFAELAFCGTCSDRFLDWLRQAELSAALEPALHQRDAMSPVARIS